MSLQNYTRDKDAYGLKRWRHNSKPILLLEMSAKFPNPIRYLAIDVEQIQFIDSIEGFKTLEEAAEAGEVV